MFSRLRTGMSGAVETFSVETIFIVALDLARPPAWQAGDGE
jgi:hypothetical protein